MLRRSGIELDVLLVDDSSPDNTASIATDEASRLGIKIEVLTGSHLGLGRLTAGRLRAPAAHCRSRLLRHARPRRASRRSPDHRRRAHVRRPSERSDDRIAVGARRLLARHLRTAVDHQPHRQHPGAADHRTARGARRDDVVPHHSPRRRPALDRQTDPSRRVRLLHDIGRRRPGGRVLGDRVPDHVPPAVRRGALAVVLRHRRVLAKPARDTCAGRPGPQRGSSRPGDLGGAVAAAAGASTPRRTRSSVRPRSWRTSPQANRFFGWIADELKPHLGHRILEVGAGIGTIATKLRERLPASEITAIEPAENLFEELESGTTAPAERDGLETDLAGTRNDTAAAVRLHRVRQRARAHPRRRCRDAHGVRILLPRAALSACSCPRCRGLYGSLDYKSGHHRRYDKARLREVIADAGFEIVELRYIEVAGVVPYWLMYRVLEPSVAEPDVVRRVRPAGRAGEQDRATARAESAVRQEPAGHRPSSLNISNRRGCRARPSQGRSERDTDYLDRDRSAVLRLATSTSSASKSTSYGPSKAIKPATSAFCAAPTCVSSRTR